MSAALSTNVAIAVLDVAVTPELRAEGMARDVVRLVQQARKDAGLHVSDRIDLWVEADGEVQAAVDAHRAYLAAQTLAKTVTLASPPEGVHLGSGKVEGQDVVVGVARAT